MGRSIFIILFAVLLFVGCSYDELSKPTDEKPIIENNNVVEVNTPDEIVVPIQDNTCEGGAKRLIPQYLVYPTATFFNESFTVANFWNDDTKLTFPGFRRSFTKFEFSALYKSGSKEGENAQYYYMVEGEPSDLGKYIAFKYANPAIARDGTILGTNEFHMRPIVKDSGKNFSISMTPVNGNFEVTWSGFNDDIKSITKNQNLYFEVYYNTYSEPACIYTTASEQGTYICTLPVQFPRANMKDYHMFIKPNPNNFKIVEIVDPNVVFCSWVN